MRVRVRVWVRVSCWKERKGAPSSKVGGVAGSMASAMSAAKGA